MPVIPAATAPSFTMPGLAVTGLAVATIGGDEHHLHPGDALVVPPHRPYSLANPHGESFAAVAALLVGGRVHVQGSHPFAPPWAR